MEPPTTKHFRWWGNRGIWIGHSCEVVLERGFGFDENILLCCSEVHSSHNWFSEKPHKLRLALPDMKSQGFSCFAVTKQHLMKQHLSSSNRWVVDDINDIHPRYYTKHPSGQSLISVTDKSFESRFFIGNFSLAGRVVYWELLPWWAFVLGPCQGRGGFYGQVFGMKFGRMVRGRWNVQEFLNLANVVGKFDVYDL